jgi:hypothetical protein
MTLDKMVVPGQGKDKEKKTRPAKKVPGDLLNSTQDSQATADIDMSDVGTLVETQEDEQQQQSAADNWEETQLVETETQDLLEVRCL